MRSSRIFTQLSLDADRLIQLTDSRAHYITNVLRLKPGDSLTLFNGLGGEYAAQITEAGRNRVTVALKTFDPVSRQSRLNIELGLAMTKRDSMDTAIQKVTELGVMAIQPLICSRTSASQKNMDRKLSHWQAVCISACEQCGLNIPPKIESAIPFQHWVSITADLCIIANPASRKSIKAIPTRPQKVAVAVGPEGGFTSEEISIAETNGFLGIQLGPRIQRTETAAITLVSLIQAQWGDL